MPPAGALVTDGPIRAIAVGADRVYFGGEFERVGTFAGSNLRLDWTTGALRSGFARTNGQVSDVIADGNGGWYLGGGFDWVEGVRRTALVHVRADGSVERAFDARVEGFVSALALDGERLYAGGTFTRVGGRERAGVVALDARTGELDTGFRWSGTLPVPELAISGVQSDGGKRLYVHAFREFEGPGPVQALDPFSGAPIEEFAFPFEPRKPGALFVRGDRLYVGAGAGHYKGSDLGGRGALVALDGRTGAVIATFSPGGPLRGSVEDLELDGGRLVVAGDFDRVGEIGSRGVAVLDPDSGRPDTLFEAAISGRVSDLALADGRFYAAVGDVITALDARNGSSRTSALPRLDGPVDALAAAGGVLYAGGRFQLLDAMPRRGLAAIERRSGRLDPDFEPAAGPGKHAQLALAHGRLYVGDYTRVPGPLAAVSPASGRLLGAFRTPRTAPVYDFCVGRDHVYGAVGGRQRVIAFDAASGARARSFRIPAGGYVTDLECAAGRLYAAGNWDTRGGRRAVIALRPNGSLVGPFDPHVNGEVQALAAARGRLYLAGPFSRAGSRPRPHGAAVTLARGSLVGGFRPSSLPRRNVELAVGGERLFARGTRDDSLVTVRSRDGARDPSFRLPAGLLGVSALAPTRDGAWIGAAIAGVGRKEVTFLSFVR